MPAPVVMPAPFVVPAAATVLPRTTYVAPGEPIVRERVTGAKCPCRRERVTLTPVLAPRDRIVRQRTAIAHVSA
jgi:hypothetical protein